MLLTGALLDWPEESELDLIDDELFATDYRSPSQRRHRTVLPEPPTIRLRHQAPAPRYVVVTGAVWSAGAPDTGEWPSVAYRSEYTPDENGTEVVALLGLAVLLIVILVAAIVVLVWFI